MEHPGVKVHVFYGSGVNTPRLFEWTDGDFSHSPDNIDYEDGDGTVNSRSLLWGQKWTGEGGNVE